MKKNEVKVFIRNKKEYKQVRAILQGLGEKVTNDYDYMNHESFYYHEKDDEWCMAVSTDERWRDISIRDLIILLTTQAKNTEQIEIYNKSSLIGVVNINGFVGKSNSNVICISTESIEDIYKASQKLIAEYK